MGTIVTKDTGMSWKDIAKGGVLALLLAGCASGIIEKRMQPMIGRSASDVFQKLGLPDGEGEVAGRRFYLWETQTSGSHTVPSYGTGTIFNADGVSTFGYTSFRQQPYHHMCSIRVFVDTHDRVTTYDFKGNQGGCSVFARRLTR